MTIKKGFFITGTDTGIGKTFCSRLLADTFARSVPVTYMKPVQTGCRKLEDGSWYIPDYEYLLCGKARQVLTVKEHVPYCFEPACSPHLAARLAGVRIELSHIAACFDAIRRSHSGLILVEGAGGVCAPVNEQEYMIDIMKALRLPIILVTTPRLGTLNHTLLSLAMIEKYSGTLAGVIVNNSVNLTRDYIYLDNIAFIRNRCAMLPALETDYCASINDEIRIFCDELQRHYQ